jgi:hypothetical protein
VPTAKARKADVEAAEQKKREELVLFCPCCFASGDGGSWTRGEAVVPGLCSNCGAGGEDTRLPRWAIDAIRRSASWVGKRYYPCEEDKEHYDEVQALRALVKKFPGRSVRLGEDGTFWWVTQEKGGGTSTSIMIEKSQAKTAKEALEKARLSLPYVPNPKKASRNA